VVGDANALQTLVGRYANKQEANRFDLARRIGEAARDRIRDEMDVDFADLVLHFRSFFREIYATR